jgi:hypothetical protein
MSPETLMTEKRPRKTMYCETHGDSEHSLLRDHGRGKPPTWRCLQCWNEIRKRKARQNKLRAVNHKGGPSCSICKDTFVGRLECLDFHHVDPSEKEASPGNIMMGGWTRLEREIDKCILVCSNCHRTIHNGGTSV